MAKEETNTPDLKDLVAAAVKAALEANNKNNAELLKTVIEEVKKPVISETEQRQIAQANEDRERMAQQVLEMSEQKKTQQRLCRHTRKDGTSPIVFVQDDAGGYLMCQRCQIVVRHGIAPKDYKGTVVYDTDLFNRLFNASAPAGRFD